MVPAAVVLLLVVAPGLQLGLLAYAMYALLGVMLVEPLAGPDLDREPLGHARVQRLIGQRRRHGGRGDHARKRGRLPVAWVLVEDLLPRRALIYEPPSLQVERPAAAVAMLAAAARKTLYLSVAVQSPRLLPDRPAGGRDRRPVRPAPPLSRGHLAAFPAGLSQGRAAGGYDLASRRPIGEVRLTHRLYEDPTRIAGVRRYEAGDPLNRVHWRATARTGMLHSKVYEPSCIAGATLLLDFHQRRLRRARTSRIAPSWPSRPRPRWPTRCTKWASRSGWSPTAATPPTASARRAGTTTSARRNAARQAAGMLDTAIGCEPLVVETRRGPSNCMRILETLARVELTDGLNFAKLVTETAGRLPRDATVVAILTRRDVETAVALGNLRRRGLAVTAILNLYEDASSPKRPASCSPSGSKPDI